MKFLSLHLFLVVCFISTNGFTQDPTEEVAKWSSVKKLTWADYKASPDRSSDAAASTTTYLSIEYNFHRDGFTYKIQSRFSKTKSWGLHKTAYILSHEQGHFDIAEVFARKLYQRMLAYTFNKKSYQRDLNKIYQDILDEKESLQNQYDRETRHSINKEKQAEWLVKIEELLKAYEGYADY